MQNNTLSAGVLTKSREDADPLRSFSLYDIGHKSFYGQGMATPRLGGLLSLTFLELGKPGENVGDNVGHWMDFFKGRPLAKDAPGYLKEALGLTEEQDLSEQEVKMIDMIELAEEDRKGQIAYARKEGLREKAVEVASAALRKGFSLDIVADITGLDLATIKRLQSELKN